MKTSQSTVLKQALLWNSGSMVRHRFYLQLFETFLNDFQPNFIYRRFSVDSS
jgi:hypothetical protein